VTLRRRHCCGLRAPQRYRTDDGLLAIPGVVDDDTIVACLPGGLIPAGVAAKIHAVVALGAVKDD